METYENWPVCDAIFLCQFLQYLFRSQAELHVLFLVVETDQRVLNLIVHIYIVHIIKKIYHFLMVAIPRKVMVDTKWAEVMPSRRVPGKNIFRIVHLHGSPSSVRRLIMLEQMRWLFVRWHRLTPQYGMNHWTVCTSLELTRFLLRPLKTDVKGVHVWSKYFWCFIEYHCLTLSYFMTFIWFTISKSAPEIFKSDEPRGNICIALVAVPQNESTCLSLHTRTTRSPDIRTYYTVRKW